MHGTLTTVDKGDADNRAPPTLLRDSQGQVTCVCQIFQSRITVLWKILLLLALATTGSKNNL